MGTYRMKTFEDEAFDELAKKQGMWGGGFQAKRAAAADKQEPAQEPVAWMCSDQLLLHKGYERFSPSCGGAWNIPVYTAPPKREWVGLTPEETSGFTQHEMTVVKYVNKVLQEKNT